VLLGFSVGEITILVCVLLGAVSLVVGLVLLVRHHVQRGTVDIDVLKGKFKTDVPSIAAIVAGVLLVGYPLWRAYDKPPKVSISGKMQFEGGAVIENLAIAVYRARNRY